MPDEPTRDIHAEQGEPKSPEEMMQSLLNQASAADDDLPPPEDFASASNMQRFARPEDDLPQSSEPRAVEVGEVAQRFLDMQNQAATLADLLSKEEISFDDYQRLLYEAMVQDEQGVWWMIDAENEEWYRHDAVSNQWECGLSVRLARVGAGSPRPDRPRRHADAAQ